MPKLSIVFNGLHIGLFGLRTPGRKRRGFAAGEATKESTGEIYPVSKH
jgi:hypothetical protein